MSKIAIFLICLSFVNQTKAQTSAHMSKVLYEQNEVGELILQNPEHLVFDACHQNVDIAYQIEKFENSSWQTTPFVCCNCNTLLPPQYFANTVGKFKLNGAFMWQTGEYRVILKEVKSDLARAFQKLDTTQRPKRTFLQTIYTPSFFVLPPKLPAYPTITPVESRISYYEKSKLQKAVYVPHYFLINRGFTEKDTLVHQTYIKNLALKPYIRPQSFVPKEAFLSEFQKEHGQEVFFVAPQNLPVVRKNMHVGGWLLLKKNKQYALTNRIELIWNKEKQVISQEFSTWLHTKAYTFRNFDRLEETQQHYPFMHSILEIETDLPEKLVQIAEELIATGYFSSVSNIVLEPVQFVPKN
jgi:hypothetical protein